MDVWQYLILSPEEGELHKLCSSFLVSSCQSTFDAAASSTLQEVGNNERITMSAKICLSKKIVLGLQNLCVDRDHQPRIIFMDEIDAIGGHRFPEGTSANREIQRTLMELLNQVDGLDTLHRIKMIMATNRPDTVDPALLRPGRLDKKIHTDLPNEQARLDILKIHAGPIPKHGEVDYEAIVKLSDGFNGAELRNVAHLVRFALKQRAVPDTVAEDTQTEQRLRDR
ncbi:hypothetical protein EI555_005647 [Monodon monoceros]|uniref:ATPase AAA-type core domain-containing protein n=1 Tax=Monodon monoceros TaxID=40151 RepID=A0A4U1ENV9_MONMO|nr:hypothetical protein EI555_005647 [Monodon monoceros]